LNTPAYESASISCPNCSNRFMTPVLMLIDVSQNQNLKALFLSGQINVAVCPQCGHAGMLSTPLVYHDPEKELLFTFAPSDLNVSEIEQQRIIGDLTNRVISGLPADQRKGYLLRPRSFLRLEAMLDAILEADGITPEMLAAQRAKAELLERLLRATSSDTRQVIARENNDLIDYQFFQLLSLNIELAQREGQAESAQQLLGLRQQLLQWTTVGQEVSDRDEAIRSLGERVTREGLLEKVVEAALAGEPAKVETMVVVARSAIDYIFYQQLTGRIEAAEAAGRSGEADTLRELRKTILDLTAEIDAEVEAMTQEAGRSLESLLESDDPQAALHANPSLVDEYLLSALATSMRAAERSGQTERAQKLRKLNEAIVELIQENQPPEVQLVNRLLAAEFPGGTEALLKENRHLVSTQLLELMDSLGIDLAEGEQNELTRQLRQIREQAAALLPESA
jgi:hypothetical protein